MKTGSIEAVIGADISSYQAAMGKVQGLTQKAFQGAKNAAESAGSRISGGFGKSMLGAVVGGNLLTGALSRLGGGFTSLIGEMNDSSKAWQTFDGNLRMVGKSSGEIESVKSSLQQFAQQTIYSASDMASSYSQMAAIGEQSKS